MITDEAHFLDALLARPDDDEARLKYTSWLEDAGYPLDADFVRAVVEMRQDYPNGRRAVTDDYVHHGRRVQLADPRGE
jgi:uncharacterized protein (TIGR02996 family)